MIKCYEILDQLPTVPDHLVEYALSVAHESKRNWYDLEKRPPVINTGGSGIVWATKVVEDHDGTTMVTRSNPRFALNNEWNQWVQDNITSEFCETGVSVSLMPNADDVETRITQPHTDTAREFVLIYVIQKGNEDQYTEFYQETGKDVYREFHARPKRLADLTVIDKVSVPLHKWLYMDARVLHTAVNVYGDRISLMVSLLKDPFNVFDRPTLAELEQ
jgi:hypothetical protein